MLRTPVPLIGALYLLENYACVFHAIVTVDFRGVTGHFKNIVTGDFRNCVTGFVKIFEMDAMI